MTKEQLASMIAGLRRIQASKDPQAVSDALDIAFKIIETLSESQEELLQLLAPIAARRLYQDALNESQAFGR